AAEETKIQSGRSYTTNCSSYWSNPAQSICNSMPYVDVTFAEEMPEVPQIIVTSEYLFPFTPCAQGAMDAIDHIVTNVTRFGFRLYGGASPASSAVSSCGADPSSGRAISLFSWMALAKKT
ncbi:TPA: hypothetical protein ACNVA6_006841, partial [Pseudomonas aeruginosa]